jgi:hypothetical protein
MQELLMHEYQHDLLTQCFPLFNASALMETEFLTAAHVLLGIAVLAFQSESSFCDHYSIEHSVTVKHIVILEKLDCFML